MKPLYMAAPCFAAALLLVTGFCWLEGEMAGRIGRLQMGHELVRGLRLLVPLAWMLIVGALTLVTDKWTARAIFTIVLVAILYLTQDRQYMAAQYALSQYTGLELPLSAQARATARQAKNMAELYAAIKNTVPEGQPIYCPQNAMPVRYLALRPLAHAFKDGYLHFYNKDIEASEHWLYLENLARKNPAGWLAAWHESGAPWLLLPPGFLPEGVKPDQLGQITLEKNGWVLVRKDKTTR